ncbi:hypothetical protein [Actinomadura roseirufa]|uniref:hypothetical protein n=1 Tax=Actinomadura roseirufa TaxID=2094049 RepID=UPI001041619E|nr:hypothetical protein [Actinomadura roseirufa]
MPVLPLLRSGGIAVGIAALVTAAACSAGSDGTAPARKTGGASARPSGQAAPAVQGNCNAQGSNNVVTCQITPGGTKVTFGSVDVDFPGARTFLFDGPASRLPRPPDIDPKNPSTVEDRCIPWKTWLNERPDLYGVSPYVQVELTATTGGVSSVDRAEVQVYAKKKSTGGVFVTCRYGAGGGGDGFTGIVDSTTDITSVQIDDEEKNVNESLTMPPQSIVLGGVGRRVGTLQIKSDPAYLYAGQLRVHISTNGKKDVVKIGDPAHPIRWVSATPSGARYGWDAVNKKWSPGYCPLPNCNPQD